MGKRKALGNKVRFEVFKRDLFKCQYCGQSAPEVILNVDHILAVANGGDNSIMNLITSCFKCNNGKSDIAIDDSSALQKQKKQIEELAERRSQIEMMLKWKQEVNSNDFEMDKIEELLLKLNPSLSFDNKMKAMYRKLLDKYTFEKVIDAIYKSFNKNEVEVAAMKVRGLLLYDEASEEDKIVMYVRGILRNRQIGIDERYLSREIKACLVLGWQKFTIVSLAQSVRTWSTFMVELMKLQTSKKSILDENEQVKK